MYLFRLNLEPEFLNCQTLECCPVLYLQEVRDLQQHAAK